MKDWDFFFTDGQVPDFRATGWNRRLWGEMNHECHQLLLLLLGLG
jgi:hypothetical protein